MKMMESTEIVLVDENDVLFKHPKIPLGCLPDAEFQRERYPVCFAET
jgi:hypothetical protein